MSMGIPQPASFVPYQPMPLTLPAWAKRQVSDEDPDRPKSAATIRRERNREAAARYRARLTDRIEQLETILLLKFHETKQLEDEEYRLKRQVDELRSVLATGLDRDCQVIRSTPISAVRPF
jgi:hypothetical protein